MIAISSCASCGMFLQNRQCMAFLDYIPKDIWEGLDTHESEVSGDNGITFVSMESSSVKPASLIRSEKSSFSYVNDSAPVQLTS